MYLKSHVPSGRRNRLGLDRVDPRTWRSLIEGPLEAPDGLLVAFCHNLDATIRKVSNETGHALALGRVLSEIPESDALHAAGNEKALRDNHHDGNGTRGGL